MSHSGDKVKTANTIYTEDKQKGRTTNGKVNERNYAGIYSESGT